MGVRIAEARGRASLTQADLAMRTSLDRSALAKIESGARRVAALELARIADAVGERIEWFVTDASPAIVSHRNMLEPGAASPALDRLVERVTRHVEFLLEHDAALGLAETPRLDRPASADDVERAAEHARSLLGLDDSEPCTDVSGRATRTGALVFSLDLGTDAADAASVLLPRGAVVLVNGALPVGRRRLAAAHELGHCLFADEYTVDWSVSRYDESNAWESRLDRFARAVLLPRRGLEQVWSGLRSSGDDTRTAAVRTASRFRVDMSTLARRLSELGRIDRGAEAQIRSVRTTRADIVEMNLLVSDELAAPSLPREYETAVLRLFRREVVSAARATELLLDLWVEEDLPQLPELPGSAIWNFVS
jgi:Zn-dependent peptidase ImmA (M78 family)/DNA-binding XRE family transcriptional regulator